jgi:hypothetical protein
MAEGHYDISVERWSCTVSNQHRKAYGDRKIRQRTVMRLEGRVSTGAGPQTAAIYLMFERGSQAFGPTITTTDDLNEQVRVDAYLAHGQEAAVLAILNSGYRTWGRFHENALGQTSFVLESGPDAAPAPSPAAGAI